MYQVIKRDGNVVDFNITRISNAITKAFEATEKQYNQSIIDFLALKVTSDFEPKIESGKRYYTFEQCRKLAVALETSMDYLAGLTDEKKPYPKKK